MIEPGGFGEPAFFVCQAAEIDQGVSMMRIDEKRFHVGVACVTRRNRFELDTKLEPFISGMYALAV